MSNRPSSPVVGVLVVTAALAGTLLWLAMLAGPWRLATGLLEARALLDRGERHLAAGAIKAARYEILAATAAARRARAGLDSQSPLFDLARSLPAARGALDEVDHLVTAAELSARAASGTLEVAQSALRGPDKIITRDSETDEGQIRIERVEATRRVITGVRADVEGLRRELEAIEGANLPRRARPAVTGGIERANASIELLRAAEAGLALLPDLLGKQAPRTYLLAMQNNAELRGTGGSILQFALLQIDDGRPRLLPTGSVYKIDENRTQLDIPLPPDAWYVRGIEDAQRFGNANWSPDWPLSARLTLAYAQAAEAAGITQEELPAIDGMILVDPIVMQNLLKGAGPITRATGRRITAGRVIHFLLYEAYADFPIVQHRRAVLQGVVQSFYERMLKPARPVDLVEGMGRSLAGKHMQIWMARSEEQSFIQRMDWDASIERTDGDYFMVVEQNVGGNKLNYYETQAHSLDVTISGRDAVVSSAVRVRNDLLLPQPRYALGDSGPWHRPMLNVYVPRRAELLDWRAPDLGAVRSERVIRLDQPAPAAWSTGRPSEHVERGKKVWSATLEIPAGRQGRLGFDYRVPGVVRTKDGRSVYRLTLEQQPKVRPEKLTIRLTLPEGASAIKAAGWQREGQVLVWERPLDKDMTLEVSWRS